MGNQNAVATLLSLLLASYASSQDVRYELGLRVRAFENEFEAACQDVKRRETVCPLLQDAVTSFFSVRLDNVARNMDAARRQLLPEAQRGPAYEWADSLSLRAQKRFIDLKTRELAFELRSAYDVEVDQPQGATLRLGVRAGDGKELVAPTAFAIGELPMRGVLPMQIAIPVLPMQMAMPGDHELLAEITTADGTVLTRHRQTISIARALEARIEALRPLSKAKPTNTLSATARGLTRTLLSLARGGTRETDIFAARHLEEVERIAAALEAPEAAEPVFSLAHPGDFRIWLQAGGRSVATRVFVPETPAAEPTPVVVALHGAGGSENLFFDGYGAGKVVRLCRERGWLLVAPRSGFGGGASVDELVTALSEFYPVDRDRVFAVGHSMGAGQLMSDACRDPGVFRAIAALGGSGSVRSTELLQKLPVMVAPGEKDFALRGARRLRDALTAAGVETIVYREYEAAEHLGIVQIALGDVFAFFDRFAASR